MTRKPSKRKTAGTDSTTVVVQGTAGQELAGPDPGEETGGGSGAETSAAVTAEVPTDAGGGNGSTRIRPVTVELPTGEIDPGAYLSDHVEGRLTPKQRRGLRYVKNGADATGERLENRRFVQTGIDALRFLLERVADAVEG